MATPLNYTTTEGATRTPGSLTSDDYLNIARLTGINEQYSGNRAGGMQSAQKFAELGKQGFIDWFKSQGTAPQLAGAYGQELTNKYGTSDSNAIWQKMAEEQANKFESAYNQHLGGTTATTPDIPANQTMQGDTITPTPTTDQLQGINTSQPSPSTVNATPYTAMYNGQPTNFLSKEVADQYGAKEIEQGFQAAVASGKEAPQTQGEAKAAISKLTPSPISNAANNAMAAMDVRLSQDPGYQQLLADRAEYTSIANQSGSLLDFYKKATEEAGIPGINSELLNMKKVIDGTEDDIRSEVQAVQGFATDSQVLALASSRNKQLIKNYNSLLDTKAMLQEQVNTMVGLAGEDRQFALNTAMQKMQIDQQIMEYRDKFVRNAREGYQNIINAVGYGGLLSMLGDDPNAISLAESTLGLGEGQLSNISNFIENKNRLAGFQDYNITSPFIVTAGGEVQNTQTGEAYSSPQDFATRTGMSLEQANANGLIQPLGVTREEEQRQFENVLKLEDLAMSRERLGIEKARLGMEGARLGLAQRDQALQEAEFMQKMQGEALAQQTAQDKRVAEIIRANPGEWGKAAAQIEAEFGQIPAGSRTDQILNAVYGQGANINEVLPPTSTIPEKLTVDQAKARQFAVAAQEAQNILATLNYDPGYIEPQRIGVGKFGVDFPNLLKSSDRQQFEQASRALVNAVLRRESGATITDDEFNNKYKELIPQAGDSKEVLKNKEKARVNAIESIQEAGLISPAESTVKIRVKNKQTGETGTIENSEFNPNLYERI